MDNDVKKVSDEETRPDIVCSERPVRRRRPWWVRLLKWLGIMVIAILLLIVLAVSALVWYLQPERLTPLVEEYASEYLDADVSVGRVALTYWSSWPRLELQVDSLTVVSRALRGVPPQLRSQLPADADSLLSVNHIHGGVNILTLLTTGDIDLYDVCIDGPRANLVIADSEYANYNILPATEADADTTSTPIPDISVDRFRFINAGPLTFTSLPDSLSATLRLHDIDIPGLTLPQYALSLECELRSGMTRQYDIQRINVGFDGKIEWNRDEPTYIGVRDLAISIGADDDIRLDITGDVDVRDTILVNALSLRADDIDVTRLLTHLPAEFATYVKPLATDMHISLGATLTEPYAVTDSIAIPSMHVEVDIPECRVRYQNADFRSFMLKGSAEVNGRDLNATRVQLDRLLLRGRAIDMDINGTFSSLLTDPYIDATLRGQMRFDALPRVLTSRIPYDISGRIATRTRVRMRMSQLNAANFHRLYADGVVHLSDLHVAAHDSTMVAYVGDAMLDFGTLRSSDIATDKVQMRVDSLLQVKLSIDTVHMLSGGTELAVRDFSAGVGSLNRSVSADTGAINPFGGHIRIDRVRLVSEADSMRLTLRELDCVAALSRFQGDARNPRLYLDVSARRIMAGDKLNRISVTRPSFTLTANIKPRRTTTLGRRSQAMLDSLTAARPDLSADSIATLVAEARMERRRARQEADSIAAAEAHAAGQEIIDIELDEGLKGLLRRWDIRGRLRADRGRISTPYIPLPNRIRNIDFEFNTDSLVLSNLYYKVGQSDFTINGTVSNLRRAVASTRRVKQPIKIAFDMTSDTINVNELTRALLAGSAMANDSTLNARAAALDDDEDIEYTMDSDTTVMGPLVVPRNIDATFTVRSAKTLYSDLIFDDFTGQVLAYDGAVNLRRLSAATDMGSIDVSALYSAPDPTDMQFGLGMKVHNFKLDRLTTLIPAIDSLMPMMRNFAGNVNAELALTTALHDNMDLDLNALTALLKIEGDSLVLMDPETFRIASKWLFFKNKERNMIDHLSAEIAIENSVLSLYPFMFNIDRYKLGVMGHNDMDMNLDYHVSVLKSPMPFKFGINIKGSVDDMKFRLGGAKIKENMVVERVQVTDTVRVNLVEQFEKAFRRGAQAAKVGRLTFDAPVNPDDLPDSGNAGKPGGDADIPKETDATPVSTIDLLRQAINAIPNSK